MMLFHAKGHIQTHTDTSVRDDTDETVVLVGLTGLGSPV